MDRDDAIKKIQKCLALAKSPEPHEAAAAMRQAQKLMEQHNIDHPEIAASGIKMHFAKSQARKTPPRHESMLASRIAEAFGCYLVFGWARGVVSGQFDRGWEFVGLPAHAEVAAYSFDVMNKQLRKARATYIKEKLRRLKKNKTPAADEFCRGWVGIAMQQVTPFAHTDEQREAIQAYRQLHYTNLSSLKTTARTTDNGRAGSYYTDGLKAGSAARLHQGVGADWQDRLAIEGGA